MAAKKTFTKEFTQKIAELSKLQLEVGEVEYFAEQFNNTLAVIENLNELDIRGVKEAYNITGLTNVFREDAIDTKRMLTQDEALSNAKKTYKGFFVVKGILNEK